MLVVLALVVTAIAGSTSAGPSARAASGPPNFVVIVTDDQRFDTLHVMDKTRAWFSSQGTNFTSAYATTPLCCPSRSSIFTGRYAHNHGVRTNYTADQLDQRTTIQYYLRNSGYFTGIFGKYLNEFRQDPPNFDRWAVPSGHQYRNSTWNVNGNATPVYEYSTDFLEAQAETFLAETEESDLQPWLMFVTPQASHKPYTAQPIYAEKRFPKWSPNPSVNEKDVSDKPKYVRRMDRIEVGTAKKIRAKQLRTLLSVDDLVNDLFASLAELGEDENTYVFFMSDNGFAWGDHRLLSAGALKNTPYTSSIRVPFLMYGPGLEPNSIDDRLVANIDVAPTIMELAKVAVRTGPPMDGRSLLGDWSREWLLLEWWEARQVTGIPPWRSLRSKTSQYIEYLNGGEPFAREFYWLKADPFQLRNVVRDGNASNDPNFPELHERLEEYSTCSGATCP